MHPNGFVDTQRRKHVIQNRHHHDAAADAQHAGDKAADNTGDHQPKRQRAEFAIPREERHHAAAASFGCSI